MANLFSHLWWRIIRKPKVRVMVQPTSVLRAKGATDIRTGDLVGFKPRPRWQRVALRVPGLRRFVPPPELVRVLPVASASVAGVSLGKDADGYDRVMIGGSIHVEGK